jgi:hypothetical protein
MTNAELQDLVTTAVETDRHSALLTAEAAVLKKRLIAEAKRREKQQVDIPDGGKAITFAGTNGCTARVVFPKPTLSSSIDGTTKKFDKVKTLSGQGFKSLFLPVEKYALVFNFREIAQAVAPKTSAALIKLCTSNSQPRVAFETKQSPDL